MRHHVLQRVLGASRIFNKGAVTYCGILEVGQRTQISTVVVADTHVNHSMICSDPCLTSDIGHVSA